MKEGVSYDWTGELTKVGRIIGKTKSKSLK